nr:MAG TPA: PGDYG protein [Caudoviricetes sp.]
MKYKKRPVEVEAFKYDGDLKDRDGNWYVPYWGVKAFENKVLHYNAIAFDKEPELFVDTLEGTHLVRYGDYIVRGVKGELYNVRADIFEETYQKVIK